MKAFATAKTPSAPSHHSQGSQQTFFRSACSGCEEKTPFFQTSLKVSSPGDQHEIEAEAMADHVTTQLDSSSTPFFSPSSGGIQRKPFEDAPSEISRVPQADVSRSAFEPDPEIQRKADGEIEPEEKLEASGPALSRRASLQRSSGSGKSLHPGSTPHRISRRPLGSHSSAYLSRASWPADSPVPSAKIFASRARGPPVTGNAFHQQLSSSKGSGQPLPSNTLGQMESAFGSDFSGVRVHTDQRARAMSGQIHAQAFAHGQDIYFAENHYQPENRPGKHLLAHELTHVVQQGHGLQHSPSLSRAPPQIQRIPTSMEEVRQEVNDLAENVPGFSLATVLIGYNPILGRNVDWSAAAFFRGAAGLLPGGVHIYDKLNEGGAIDAAFAWIEGKIIQYQLNLGRVNGLWDTAWEQMGITEGIEGNLTIFRNTFSGFFGDVMSFIGDCIAKLTEILRDLAVAAVRALFGDDGPAYDLICMVLGQDPLTGESREWVTVDFLRSAMMLFGFSNHVAKMDETGQLQNAADWLDLQFGILSAAVIGLITGVTAIWDSLSLETLASPLETLTQTVNVVIGFVAKLVEFAGNVAIKILELVKEIIIGLLRTHAHRIPGYRLFTVVIGKDPVTGEEVPRTAMNFVHGFLQFVPDGEEIYANLEAGNAIGKAMDWLSAQAEELGLTPTAIVARVTELWSSFSIDDLMHPLPAFVRVGEIFLGFIADVLTLAGRIALKLLEILFEVVMGSGGDRVLAILKQAQGTFNTIVEDPIAFVGNLVNAAKQGFMQFGSNILDHLIDGLTGWLFGALEGAGIQIPQQFDLEGILSLVLQILGLTYAQIRPQLVEQLGEETVAHLESAFEVVRILVTEGLAGIWSRITEFITVSLPEMIIGGIQNFVMSTIVGAAITRIASMLNPAGAVIQAIIAIYNTIMFFIERMNQIITTVEAYVNSISKIASGNIGDAANAVENAMASTLPVIISFLARLIGLGGISDRIREIIQRIQTPIQAAIGRIIAWIVGQARRLGNALFGGGAGSGPETPQSEEVKNEAQRRLQQRLPRSDDRADIQSAVQSVEAEMIPRGLTSLRIQDRSDGSATIVAVASPPRDLFNLTVSVEPGSRGTAAARSVSLVATVTFAPPQVASDPSARTPGTLPSSGTARDRRRGMPSQDFDYVTPAHWQGGIQVQGRGVVYDAPGAERSPQTNTRGVGRTNERDLFTGGAVFEDSDTRMQAMHWNTGGQLGAGTTNASHAEVQFATLYGQQPDEKRARATLIQVAINPMSPCDACAGTLASLLRAENQGRTPDNRVRGEVSWTEAYVSGMGGNLSHQRTSPTGLAALQAAGWRMFGPQPSQANVPTAGRTQEEIANDLDQFEIIAVQRKPKNGAVIGDQEKAADHHAEQCINQGNISNNDHSLNSYGEYFGEDFSNVRVHNHSRSAEMCDGCQARAFTHGSDIYFNRGEYDPGSRRGQNLLAHELTHVVQQNSGQATTLQAKLKDAPAPNQEKKPAAVLPGNTQGRAPPESEKGTAASEVSPTATPEKPQANATPAEAAVAEPPTPTHAPPDTNKAVKPEPAAKEVGVSSIASAKKEPVAPQVDASRAEIHALESSPERNGALICISQIDQDFYTQQANTQLLADLKQQEIALHFTNTRTALFGQIESQIDFAQGIITGQQTTLQAGADALLASAEGSILSTLQSGQAVAGQITCTIGAAVGQAQATVTSLAAQGTDRILDLVNSPSTPDLPGIEMLRSLISSGLQGFSALLSQTLSGITGLIQTVLSTAMNSLNRAAQSFSAALSQVISHIRQLVLTAIQTVAGALSRIIQHIGTSLRTLLNATLIPILSQAEQAQLAHVDSLRDAALEQLQANRSATLQAIHDALVPPAGEIDGGNATMSSEDAILGFQELTRAAYRANAQVFTTLRGQLGEISIGVIGALQNVLSAIVSKVQETITTIVAHVQSLMSAIIAQISQAIQTLMTHVARLVALLEQVAARISSVVRGFLLAPVQSIQSLISTLLSRGGSILSGAVSRFISSAGLSFGGAATFLAPAPALLAPAPVIVEIIVIIVEVIVIGGSLIIFVGGKVIIVVGGAVIVISKGLFIVLVLFLLLLLLLLFLLLLYLLWRLLNPAPKPAPKPKPKPTPTPKPRPRPRPKPKKCPCGAPTDIAPGMDIAIPSQPAERERVGKVIAVFCDPIFFKAWVIQYRPLWGRSRTSVTTRAYDTACRPRYVVPGDCKITFPAINTIAVPARPEAPAARSKSGEVLAVPLCWANYQAPGSDVVGWDRISNKGSWPRAHLVNGRWGGPGAAWNLVPVPRAVNNGAMPGAYEIALTNLITAGKMSGKFYWFRARVSYNSESGNPPLGHFEDFATSIAVSYGEAVASDSTWTLLPGVTTRVSIPSGRPNSSELISGRLSG